MTRNSTSLRRATLDDLDALNDLEKRCFENDRLSRRQLRHWLQVEHGILLVAEVDKMLAGYGLVWLHRGTRLARLYSLAVSPEFRGRKIADQLMDALEEATEEAGRLFMRLEVAKRNSSAIKLYERHGYQVFGEYSDYYEDHDDALRMQKTIRHPDDDSDSRIFTPWYQQSTDFTCGPAALMMAMAQQRPDQALNQSVELDLWREATTIFMAAGHGGSHPIGLALAAARRGFSASVVINSEQPLFVEGVRSDEKKSVLQLVHHQFVDAAEAQGVAIEYAEPTVDRLEGWLRQSFAVMLLISTYALDGRKIPHWVTVTGLDEQCVYVHDPDLDPDYQRSIDCQYVPIARDDFRKLSTYGSSRLRTAVLIRK